MPDKIKEISRVRRTKEEAKSTYDKLSPLYDSFIGRIEKKYRDTGLGMLNAGNGEKILEIGFGPGHCLAPLAKSVGESGKVYGIDLSEKMLKRALEKVEDHNLSERVELTSGDAVNLPYQANIFNGIFTSFTLELFDTPEIPVFLSECKRVLQDRGRLCVVALSALGKDDLMTRLYESAHQKFPRWLDCRPIYTRMELERAGFIITDHREMSMWGLTVEVVLGSKLDS